MRFVILSIITRVAIAERRNRRAGYHSSRKMSIRHVQPEECFWKVVSLHTIKAALSREKGKKTAIQPGTHHLAVQGWDLVA